MKKEVLVSITTAGNPDWRKSLADLKEYGIKRFAIFTTMVPEPDTCRIMLEEIKKQIPDAKIPFAHIHQKMTPDELDFMIDNFGSRAFNIHPTREFPLMHDYSKYLDMIYIENAGPSIQDGLKDSDIDGFAGVCLDVSHLENAKKLDFPGYQITLDTLKKFKIGANHISAIYDLPGDGPVTKSYGYAYHEYKNLNEFDYLKDYNSDFFGPYIALEIYNQIAEQIEAKKYIENILDTKKDRF